MKLNFKSFFRDFVEIIYPRATACIACGKEARLYNRYGFCDTCYATLPFIEAPYCSKCGRTIKEGEECNVCKDTNHVFTQALSVFKYEAPISDMIQRFKYRNNTYLAEPMARLMVDAIEDRGWEFDGIVPVPLHVKRLNLRGYNQAAYLAYSIGKLMGGKEVLSTVLIRIRNTPSQIGMDRDERMWNLYKSFEVRQGHIVEGKTILLVDDVLTTGSTVDHCSSVLLEAGAQKIYVATFASSVYE